MSETYREEQEELEDEPDECTDPEEELEDESNIPEGYDDNGFIN